MKNAKNAPHRFTKHAIAGLLLTAFAAAAATPAIAQQTAQQAPSSPLTAQDSNILRYSSALHLPYVANPSPAVNEETRQGLTRLAEAMAQRTAVAPAGIVSIDLERDDISLFPFLYFPVTAESQALSPTAQRQLQSYIDNGGFVLIDTRDYGALVGEPRDLRRVLGDVRLRPLVPVANDHVLTRSFYLVNGLPGTTPDGTIWVEQAGPEGSEIVTSVIIGGRNWAGAWAGTTIAPRSRDHEMALRTGINIIMHALTGNYKADQTHIQEILDRIKPAP